ncbi:MAG: PPOX class F420-dependent oxidoreductase [Chloroflexi bacterium]|nr:PPOX class F420-dependent oxidoreductase [Chloroflexota bacterium]
MAATIPDSIKDLLEGPVVVTLVTVMPNGQPQATPVWCSYDGSHIWVNSALGRQKDRNMRANQRVTILAMDPKNAYRWVEVRGKVDEITEEGALDHINLLSKLYNGIADYYSRMPNRRGKETRVIYKIKPVKVNGTGV